MFKSLQSKMILLMFVFISIVMMIVAIFSMIKMEQIYYRGFAEEMLNTIASFGINITNLNDKNVEYEEVNKEVLQKENLSKIYNNFSTYFSLNNISRTGMILNKEKDVLFKSKNDDITNEASTCIDMALSSREGYAVYNNARSDRYYFSYLIEYDIGEEKNIEYIILVEQSKEYIMNQLKEVLILYVISIVVVAAVTIIIAIMFASNITKPIESIRQKAEMIADGDIEQLQLTSKKNAGYEISRLVDSFNLMTSQIKNNLNEISNEKNKLETILLHLTDGVLAFNVNGEIVHANLTAKKVMSIKGTETFDEVFKKYDLDINLEKIIYLEDWTSSEQMVNVGDVCANIFFAPYRDEQDRPTGVIAVIQDITKQAKLDDMRKEFVANVSHELKTPLTSIKTYTETLLEEDLDIETKNKFLNVILTESNRMARLVQDLLQLTKFDYKKIAWNKISFDLPELVKQICEKHKIQADNKNQILDCYITASVPNVYADRDGIEQVVTNILTNSIKYTPDGGNIKVYVGAVHDDAYIKIIDNGIGVPKEDLPRVFERFYRVDKARSREMGGTGLGLPIAKEIIEANDGSITMNSEVGKGTEVIMKIPCNRE